MPTNNAVNLFRGSPGQTPQKDSGRLARAIADAKVTPIKTVDLNDDPEMLALVAHVLKPGETLGEFYSRTGLSKSQAALMSKAEILGFCLTVERADDPNAPSPAWKPKAIPSHFVLD